MQVHSYVHADRNSLIDVVDDDPGMIDIHMSEGKRKNHLPSGVKLRASWLEVQ
jgi:hypothetical protein